MGSGMVRRAWVAEMSAYIKSLDPYHLVTPGIWGYRTALERREWLEVHRIPTVDFCDVHHYPRDDHDSFVESPQALSEFIDNRAAAAFSLNKPLVFGEFGMAPEGYKGSSAAEWFRAFFEHSARAGAAGAMFWIWTPDPKRGYGVSYTTPRDEGVRAEIRRAAELFASLKTSGRPVLYLTPDITYTAPVAFTRPETDAARAPTHCARRWNAPLSLQTRACRERALREDGGGQGISGAQVWAYE